MIGGRMNFGPWTGPVLLILAASAPGQVTFEGSLETDLLLQTRYLTLDKNERTIKKGTVLPGDFTNRSGQDASFAFKGGADRASYHGAAFSDIYFKHGEIKGTALLRLRSQRPMTGVLVFRYSWDRGPHGYAGGIWNTLESSLFPKVRLLDGWSKRLRVHLDAKGVWFRHEIRNSNLASVDAGIHASKLTIEFQEDERITSYGSGCGPTLQVETDAYNRIRFTGRGLRPSPARAGLVFGAHSRNIPIPGGRCTLLTDPIVPLPMDAATNGTSVMSLSRVGGKYRYYCQILEASSGVLRSSNGVQVHVF